MSGVKGRHNATLGINTKGEASGKCNHPQKKSIDEKYVDGRPIPSFALTHCVFCRKDGNCYFAGECEHKEEFDNA